MSDRNTFFPKLTDINFTVRNLETRRRIHIFNFPIDAGRTKDLLDIPEISEADIRHSLLKGELAFFLRNNIISIVSSTIDLTQYDGSQQKFLLDNNVVSETDILGSIIFGGGHDGSVQFDGINQVTDFSLSNGVYTQIRDTFLSDGSKVYSGITVYTDGYRLFCNGTLTNDGIIHNDGYNANGITGAVYAIGSLGIGMGGVNGRSTNGNGTNGQGQANGQFEANAIGGSGGNVGGNTGGTGGTYTVGTSGRGAGGSHFLMPMLTGYLFGSGSGGNSGALYPIGGGASGGSGASDGTATSGASGGGGGVMVLVAVNLINNGAIHCRGGNGANAAGAGNAGGGGGGGGGALMVVTRFSSGTGTMDCNAGSGGLGTGTGQNGSSGNAGFIHLHSV